MRLSQWRPSFQAYLQQYVNFAGGFGLSTPDTTGVFVGHLPPLFNTRYVTRPPDSAIGESEQWLFLLARYPNSLPYTQLPIGALEGLYATLCLRLLWNWGHIVDTTGRPGWAGKPLLMGFQVLEQEYPVKVVEDSYENRDWLIQLSWKFLIAFEAEPEQPIDPVLLTELDIDVYRSTLRDINTAVLDARLPNNYS